MHEPSDADHHILRDQRAAIVHAKARHADYQDVRESDHRANVTLWFMDDASDRFLDGMLMGWNHGPVTTPTVPLADPHAAGPDFTVNAPAAPPCTRV